MGSLLLYVLLVILFTGHFLHVNYTESSVSFMTFVLIRKENLLLALERDFFVATQLPNLFQNVFAQLDGNAKTSGATALSNMNIVSLYLQKMLIITFF